MIKYIPRIFKEDLYLLGKLTNNYSRNALLMVSTLCNNYPIVYFVYIRKQNNHILAVRPSNVLWTELQLRDKSHYKLYSSVLSGMVEKYSNSSEIKGVLPIVKEYKMTKAIPVAFTRFHMLQEMLRLRYVRDMLSGLTTGSRQYSVHNSSHIKRVIADYHAELSMTFGKLLPLPKDIRDDPENDESIGRVLELFMQNCKKLNVLIDLNKPLDEEFVEYGVNYTFAADRRFVDVMHHVMNPFISMKF